MTRFWQHVMWPHRVEGIPPERDRENGFYEDSPDYREVKVSAVDDAEGLSSPGPASQVAAPTALQDLADEWDREAAERKARLVVADVRCCRCDLRYGEREEYSCVVAGRAHEYDQAELAAAAMVHVEPTYDGDRLRACAADIEGLVGGGGS